MVCTFTPECATESPGGLIKCKLLIPIPEFMIQWVWAGTQVLAFLEFPGIIDAIGQGIIDAIGYFENPWSKTIIKLNLHICIELLKYSRFFYFLLLVILTSLQRWRGFWWCHWVKWGSGKVSQLPQVDRVSDRPQVCLQSLPVPCLSPAEDKSWQPILGLQVKINEALGWKGNSCYQEAPDSKQILFAQSRGKQGRNGSARLSDVKTKETYKPCKITT